MCMPNHQGNYQSMVKIYDWFLSGNVATEIYNVHHLRNFNKNFVILFKVL